MPNPKEFLDLPEDTNLTGTEEIPLQNTNRLTARASLNEIKDFVNPGGGGAPLARRTLLIDPSKTEVPGSIYQTLNNAAVYMAAQGWGEWDLHLSPGLHNGVSLNVVDNSAIIRIIGAGRDISGTNSMGLTFQCTGATPGSLDVYLEHFNSAGNVSGSYQANLYLRHFKSTSNSISHAKSLLYIDKSICTGAINTWEEADVVIQDSEIPSAITFGVALKTLTLNRINQSSKTPITIDCEDKAGTIYHGFGTELVSFTNTGNATFVNNLMESLNPAPGPFVHVISGKTNIPGLRYNTIAAAMDYMRTLSLSDQLWGTVLVYQRHDGVPWSETIDFHDLRYVVVKGVCMDNTERIPVEPGSFSGKFVHFNGNGQTIIANATDSTCIVENIYAPIYGGGKLYQTSEFGSNYCMLWRCVIDVQSTGAIKSMDSEVPFNLYVRGGSFNNRSTLSCTASPYRTVYLNMANVQCQTLGIFQAYGVAPQPLQIDMEDIVIWNGYGVTNWLTVDGDNTNNIGVAVRGLTSKSGFGPQNFIVNTGTPKQQLTICGALNIQDGSSPDLDATWNLIYETPALVNGAAMSLRDTQIHVARRHELVFDSTMDSKHVKPGWKYNDLNAATAYVAAQSPGDQNQYIIHVPPQVFTPTTSAGICHATTFKGAVTGYWDLDSWTAAASMFSIGAVPAFTTGWCDHSFENMAFYLGGSTSIYASGAAGERSFTNCVISSYGAGGLFTGSTLGVGLRLRNCNLSGFWGGTSPSPPMVIAPHSHVQNCLLDYYSYGSGSARFKFGAFTAPDARFENLTFHAPAANTTPFIDGSSITMSGGTVYLVDVKVDRDAGVAPYDFITKGTHPFTVVLMGSTDLDGLTIQSGIIVVDKRPHSKTPRATKVMTREDSIYGLDLVQNVCRVSGTGGVSAITIDNGGHNYQVNDVLNIVQSGSGGNAQITVDAVNLSGTVTSATVTTAGNDYVLSSGLATSGGFGTSCTVTITTMIPASTTIASVPSIEDGAYDGQELLVQGKSDTGKVTLQDESNLTGSQLKLTGGADVTLGKGDNIKLTWDEADQLWYEISRSNV